MAQVTGFQFHGSSKKLTIFYKDDPVLPNEEQRTQWRNPTSQAQTLRFPQLRLHVGADYLVKHEIDPKCVSPVPKLLSSSPSTAVAQHLFLEYHRRRSSGSGCSCHQRDSTIETHGQLHPFAVHVVCNACCHSQQQQQPPSEELSVSSLDSDTDGGDSHGDEKDEDDPMLSVSPTGSPIPWSQSDQPVASDEPAPCTPPRLPPTLLQLSPSAAQEASPARLLFPLNESGHDDDDHDHQPEEEEEEREDAVMDETSRDSDTTDSEMEVETDSTWPPADWPDWMREQLLRSMVVGFTSTVS